MRISKCSVKFIVILISILTIPYDVLPAMLVEKDSTDISSPAETQPGIRPGYLWVLTQLLPSPSWTHFKNQKSQWGMNWQVTPLLYGFGMNKRMNPWRTLIAEPMTRYNGSLEIYFSPEYLSQTKQFDTSWLFRGGLRAYLPLYRYGEYLSASLGTSYYNYNGKTGMTYEAGVYMFFGIIGLQTAYSPDTSWSLTLRFRYF